MKRPFYIQRQKKAKPHSYIQTYQAISIESVSPQSAKRSAEEKQWGWIEEKGICKDGAA